MNVNFKTAANFRKRLELSLQTHSRKTGESIKRLFQKVAFDRFLARIFTQESSPFFLKGGYAMELRIAHARATKDIDLTYFKRVRDAVEPMSQLIWQELQTFARVNLHDHFIYQIGEPLGDIENAPYGGSRHTVSAFIDNRPFAEFPLDVGGDFLIDYIEKVPGANWLEFYGIDAPIISMISIEQQFAEKLHSYTLPRTHINSRAKDLIDLMLLINFNNQDLAAFRHSVQRVFRARNTHLLPEILPEPPVSWHENFQKMALECGISPSLKDGFTKVSQFYDALQRIDPFDNSTENVLEIVSKPIGGNVSL